MKTKVLYVAATRYKWYEEFTERFLSTYSLYPSGLQHDLVVIVNGDTINDDIKKKFTSRVQCEFFQGDNVGCDIGAYIKYSNICYNADSIVCCGTPTYFEEQSRGWLYKLSQAWEKYGPNCYGTNPNVRPSLRSACMCMPPYFLRSYPHKVEARNQRRDFEDGPESIAWWTAILKHKTYLVTCSDVYELPIVNGHYWNGDTSDIIMVDNNPHRHEYGE